MTKLQRLRTRTHKFFRFLLQTAGFLSTLLTLLAALGVTSAALGFLSHELLSVIMGVLIFILSGCIFIFIYSLLEEKGKTMSPIDESSILPPSPEVERDFEILLKEIVYQHSPDGFTMHQRKRYQLRAMRDGVRLFTDKYRWTGYGKCLVKSLTPGFIIRNERREEFWSKFDITFPHSLRKGDEVDFAIEWQLVDSEKIAVPFLATMIDYPTKQVSLQVILPPELAPKRAYCYEFANYMDNLPVTVRELQWSPATQRLTYDVVEPKLHHKYSIHWYNE